MSIKRESNGQRLPLSDLSSDAGSANSRLRPDARENDEDNAIDDPMDECAEDGYWGEDHSDGGYSDEDESVDDPALPWHPILEHKKKMEMLFHVRGTYASWGPREAYRELVQNWYDHPGHSTFPVPCRCHKHSLYHHTLTSLHRRDAIIESNRLDPKDFSVTLQATPPGGRGKTEIVYKAFGGHPDSGAECLGFVRFIGQHGLGTIELSNLRATLHPDHLDFGGTTKKGRQNQAGAHGEGLKLAIMILMQSSQNHTVFACSGGVNYTFNFNTKGKLVARLSRNDKTQPHPQPKKLSISTPAVMPTGDVHFMIGQKKPGRNELGLQARRTLVRQEDFASWSEVSLDLIKARIGDQSDQRIINTPHGDLLVSPDFRGKLFLKGLLLRESTESRSASMTGLRLAFGYNFAFGRTNRERQSVADAYEEATGYGRILCHALRDRPDLSGKVCDHLNSTEPRYAESQCPAIIWPRDVAVMFKQNLLRGELANRWLYYSKEQDEVRALGDFYASFLTHGC